MFLTRLCWAQVHLVLRVVINRDGARTSVEHYTSYDRIARAVGSQVLAKAHL